QALSCLVFQVGREGVKNHQVMAGGDEVREPIVLLLDFENILDDRYSASVPVLLDGAAERRTFFVLFRDTEQHTAWHDGLGAIREATPPRGGGDDLTAERTFADLRFSGEQREGAVGNAIAPEPPRRLFFEPVHFVKGRIHRVPSQRCNVATLLMTALPRAVRASARCPARNTQLSPHLT